MANLTLKLCSQALAACISPLNQPSLQLVKVEFNFLSVEIKVSRLRSIRRA